MPEAKFQDYREPSFVQAGGVRTAYRRQGRGEPLLFLQGGGLTRRWSVLYEVLSKQRDVIVPEHPGFGESELPASMNDFTDLALHYASVLQALSLDAVHLVGYSFGGWAAAMFAAVYPEKVKSLTLIAPMGLRPPAEVAMPNLFRMAPEDGLKALLGADAGRFAPYFDEGDAAAQAVQDYQELMSFARFTWNPRYDLKLEARLSRITAPTQVILPEHDAVVPVQIGQRYAQLIAGATLVTLKGTEGRTEHLLALQEPQRLAEQVLAVGR